MANQNIGIRIPPRGGDFEGEVRKTLQQIVRRLGSSSTPTWESFTLSGLTATRLVQSDALKSLISVSALTAWIAGTTNQITVTDDGDGTVTLSTPQDIHTGASPQFANIEVGAASDTTLARSSAGNLSIEGNVIHRTGGVDVPLLDGGTGASTASVARTNLGLGTGNDVQFTSLKTTGYRIIDLREVTDSTTTIAADDHYISIQYTDTGTHIATLPAIASGNHGKVYILKDADYNASANNITVAITGSDTVEGQSSGIMNSDGQAWSLIANNTTKNWELF